MRYRIGCAHCQNAGPELGWIETDNNGPIAPCPMCNPNGRRDRDFDLAEAQRESQRSGK